MGDHQAEERPQDADPGERDVEGDRGYDRRQDNRRHEVAFEDSLEPDRAALEPVGRQAAEDHGERGGYRREEH